jgi:hypothetical protein
LKAFGDSFRNQGPYYSPLLLNVNPLKHLRRSSALILCASRHCLRLQVIFRTGPCKCDATRYLMRLTEGNPGSRAMRNLGQTSSLKPRSYWRTSFLGPRYARYRLYASWRSERSTAAVDYEADCISHSRCLPC